MTKRALIGMSGGVDSSVAAWLALEAGYRCEGATLRLHGYSCGGAEDARDAAAVAEKLGIPHRCLPWEDGFEEHVILPFVTAYEQGLTPNPCIRCNNHLKFGGMLRWALGEGFDYVVSGHYARVQKDPVTGRTLLYRALDRTKDQTYFLAGLDQHQLSHILFPLGELTKAQARQIAETRGLITARKRDSQDSCFIPGGDYAAFLLQ